MRLTTRNIFKKFVADMEWKLEKHNQKRPSETDAEEMLSALKDELRELEEAYTLRKHGYGISVKGQCANIANFAMFVSHHTGGLKDPS